ncbi:MAG: HAMP domain-containing histidine kinase [Clostridiales bacterium]|nr:HAMP domain-containing histidine kinase [Clostridiales bacterium]
MEGIADTPEKRVRYLQAIKTRTGNLVSLVDSLSEYSKLDHGFRYRMETTELGQYIEDYLETVKTDAEHNQVNMEFLYKKGSYLVKLDRKEFKRVFDNLFTNTVKYRVEQQSHVLISMKRTLPLTELQEKKRQRQRSMMQFYWILCCQEKLDLIYAENLEGRFAYQLLW